MIRKLIVVLLLCATNLPHAHSFEFFGTYWSTGAGKSLEQVGLGIPASQMQQAFDVHTKDNLEMRLIDAYDVNGKVFFNFVFQARTSSSWTARFGLTGSEYQRVYDSNKNAGRCLSHIDVYRQGVDNIRYAAIFKNKGCVPQIAYHGVSPRIHQEKFDSLNKSGWDPVNVSVVSIGGKRTIAAFYEKRSGSFSLKSFLTTDGIGEHNATMENKGMRIVYMDAYSHAQGALPRYSAIWRKIGEAGEVGHNLGGSQVTDLGNKMHNAGQYIRYLTGFGMSPESHRYNVAMYKPKRAIAVRDLPVIEEAQLMPLR